MTDAVPTAALAAAAEACPFVNRDALQRALEAAQPHIAAAERDRIRQGSPHRVEAGGEYCQEDGFRWPCRTARWLADLLGVTP